MQLTDQARTILKKGWFSDLQISEQYQQIKEEEYQQDYVILDAKYRKITTP